MPDRPNIFVRIGEEFQSRIAESLVTLLGLAVTAFLGKHGDRIFDTAQQTVGKTLLLQVFCISVFAATVFGVVAFKKKKTVLQHQRGLYWKSGDAVPFCPTCWHDKERPIHLFGPVEMATKTSECWRCGSCAMEFFAKEGGSFLPGKKPLVVA